MCQIRISCSPGETIQGVSSIRPGADVADISWLHQIVPERMSFILWDTGRFPYLDQISMWCEGYGCPRGDVCWEIKKSIAFMMLANLHKILGTGI